MVLPALSTRTLRDLTVIDHPDGTHWVIACDSVGGIGPKPHDSYAADARTVAHFAARVPLIEVIAAGATPEIIVDTLSVERDGSGNEMIGEVVRLAASLGLSADRVTGSTEDNVPVAATGIGVTVIGRAERLRAATARSGDRVLVLGRPTSAPHDRIEIDDARMISLATLVSVLALDGVHDVLPVGSTGVGREAGVLASSNRMRFVASDEHEVDVHASGGPASCVLVAVDEAAVGAVLESLPVDLPTAILGTLR